MRPLLITRGFCGNYARCRGCLLMANASCLRTFFFFFDSSTGDQVIMREDGNIYVVDRIKHIIKHKVRFNIPHLNMNLVLTPRPSPIRDFK